jgi:hypothetical protein
MCTSVNVHRSFEALSCRLILLVPCFAYSSTLKMEAVGSSVTSVDFIELHGATS